MVIFYTQLFRCEQRRYASKTYITCNNLFFNRLSFDARRQSNMRQPTRSQHRPIPQERKQGWGLCILVGGLYKSPCQTLCEKCRTCSTPTHVFRIVNTSTSPPFVSYEVSLRDVRPSCGPCHYQCQLYNICTHEDVTATLLLGRREFEAKKPHNLCLYFDWILRYSTQYLKCQYVSLTVKTKKYIRALTDGNEKGTSTPES